jgi:IS4 transposase
MEGFAKEVAIRLPLGEAVLRLFDFVCQEELLNRVFQEHRGRSYEDEIKFPLFVQLIADALLKHDGSGRKSFQRAEINGDLTTTIRAPYGKLARVPLSLSIGFLSEATSALNQIYPQSIASQDLPACLEDLEVIYYDGKKIKHVAKRLKALQKVRGHILGGKLVVAQSLSTGMALAMGACEDGETGDPPLVPDVLGEVRRVVPGPRLHVGDRGFCDLNQANLFVEQTGDHFLVRWNRRLHFHRDKSRKTIRGTDRRGLTYQEDWGWIGSENDPRRRYVRRIHLERPGEDEDVIVLTDLTDPNQYPADDLLQVYLQRWGIEQMFQKVTEVFHLHTLIGSTPQATVFQASFCLLLYNMIQVMRAYIAEGQKIEAKKISLENLFYDVQRQLIAWNEVLSVEATVRLLSTTWTAAQLAKRLRDLLHGQWSECWRKTPSNTHRTPPKNTDYLVGGHNSVYRLVQQARGRT